MQNISSRNTLCWWKQSDSSFLNSQLKIGGYNPLPLYPRIRDSHKGGKIVFARESLIIKRLEKLEAKLFEIVCLELAVSNKKKIYTVFA